MFTVADKIQLLNPNSAKKGAIIDKQKYETVKETIMGILEEKEIITFKELMGEVSHRLCHRFEGSPSWYCTVVKLDLEARNIVERVDRSSPQRVRLVNK